MQQFCQYTVCSIGRISELTESEKCNLPSYEAKSHTEVPRVGRSEWTMQLTIIQYFTINSDNGEWSRVPHGGQKQLLDKYDNFLEKHIHLPLPIALSFFLKVRKE